MWRIICSIGIFILGVLLIVNPKIIWKIKHLFDVKGGEPTDGYIIFSRCVGIFGLIVGIALFIVLL